MKTLISIGAAAMLFASVATEASIFKEQSLQEFVVKSSASVVGKVTGVETKRRGGLMVREFTLSVSETIYGNAQSEIKVTTPGGAVPNTLFAISQVVDGSPQLRVGQEVMLVLNDMPNKDGYSVSGLATGVLSLRQINGARFVNMNNGKGLISFSNAVKKLKEMRNSAQ